MSTGFEFLRKDYEQNKITIDHVRYIALWGHPLYYVICAVLLPQPYESFELRFASAISFIPLLYYKNYPDSAAPWVNIYWYAWLTFTFPFIFTYLTLMNDLSGLWLVAETVMLITFIAFIPNHLVMTILLLSGLVAANSAYTFTTGNHFMITAEIIEYFVSIPIAILLGFVLNYTAKKNAVAHERNNVLQSMAASIAHEMRNPLGQIRQCLNSIQSILPPFHPETKSVSLSTSSINDIYHRVAHGQIAVKRGVQVIDMILGEIRNSPIDMNSFSYLSAASITRKALDEYGYESEEERDRVKLYAEENFTFHISETLFIFVIFNLLKNALYYLGSHADTEITIRLKKGDTCNYILFRDTGPGIEKKDLPYIFESFNSKGKKGGTGVGLSYCKRIMQAFGGDITCSSEKERYTEFTLSFPVIDSARLERFNAEIIANALPDFENKRLLIVDDDKGYRLLLTKHLQPLNARIDTAQGGFEALEKTRMHRYDIIIMDLNMPDLNGYKTTERIRQEENRRHHTLTPIVACSTEPAYIAKAMARKSGMQAMLVKPCTQFELINTMRSALRSGISREMTRKMFSTSLILLVEDSALNRELLAMTLKDAGLHVKIAVNGNDGWQKLHKEEFDLVITDVHMPEIDGLELTRRVRKSSNKRLRELPIIGLSGSAEEEKTAKKAGMNEFKLKTDTPESLLNTIGKLLSNSSDEPYIADMATHDTMTLEKVNLQASADTFGLPLHEIEQLFKIFLTDASTVPGMMQQALKQRDLVILQSEAHKLKGNASLFGAQAIVSVAETIERNCRNKTTDTLEQDITDIKNALLELSQQYQ